MKLTFEESIDIIDAEILKRKHRWHLTAIAWMDFEDVAQKIRLHIYNKWDKWNPDRPLQPWLNQVINNQMTNILRNNYSNFSRPCLGCKFNTGDGRCELYGEQSNYCRDYAKWEKTKKPATDVKFPVSLNSPISKENGSTATLESLLKNSEASINIEQLIPNFHAAMKRVLNNIEWRLYTYLYIDGLDEACAAKMMGYKLSLKEGRPAYRQISKIKWRIFQKAKLAIKEVI
jgi:DNA-directed RNA polymerase specialized sigma24 family protein